jgi:hypothetical protein
MRQSVKIPDGLNESDVLSIMDKVVSHLSPSFKFGYFDIEDMRQEGTIFCLEAIDNFNFDKSTQDDVGNALYTFLKTHVRWRFLNMRRKQLQRLEPPVCDCELCKNDSPNRTDCKKYSNWVKRNTAKKSLMEPFDVDEIHARDTSDKPDIDEQILSSSIMSILDEHMPYSIRSDYRRFIEGDSITKKKKEKVVAKIKEILREHNNEDWAT